MPMTLQETIEKRANAVHNMRELLNKANKEARDLTDAEETEYSGWEKEVVEYNSVIDKSRKQVERLNWLKEQEDRQDKRVNPRKSSIVLDDKGNPVLESERESVWTPIKDYDSTYRYHRYNERRLIYSPDGRGTEEYSKAYKSYLRGGNPQVLYKAGFDDNTIRTKGPDFNYQQSDDDVRGGYTVVPETFMEGLLKNVDDQTWIWKNSRVIMVRQAQSLGIRKLSAKMSCWNKGSELSDAFDNEDDSIRYGKRYLTPYYFTGAARLSRDLIRVSTLDVESLLYSEFARDLGYVIEQYDVDGNGDRCPLGVLTADNDGISTARDFTASAATTFKIEDLYDAKYGLKPQYRNRARWMFHRNRVRDMLKLRSDSGAGAGTGDFLWQPAVRAGEPDTVLGLPVDENEFFPSTAATGTYFGLLAVWEYYVHAIALDMEILRLVETRAAKNQIEYVGRVKLDGMPVLEEAFSRLKFA